MTSKKNETYLPSPQRYGKRELTEMQLKLLDSLEEANYNPIEAAKLAGYKHPVSAVRAVREELSALIDDMIANSALEAAKTIRDIMVSPVPVPQARERMEAAKTTLDRAGHAKKELVDVRHTVKGGVFIIPEKEPIDIPAEDAVIIDE
jgi:hypothetical protein